MDATTLGGLLVGVGTVLAGVLAFWGKHKENALTGYSSLTDNLQEERDRLDSKVNDLNARLAEQSALRAADQAEIARLRLLITQLGGTP
ncbi:hypothetical protein [Streptomyces tendae]|uniref:hypothetical protein n=1 Tax=Streptomyces tendae TaxID=1932 RepID=UPI003D744340